ncbi:hypothetical protein CDQ92_01970 [Sphingopyxis bauzanensis]|uniref:Uncharacterized protein n=1 Tax=Sphingopyxis bauzanensis TaxID=651663 RepID=A0A246K1X5_9SPHN|nr:hypothetical protein CDQ92_01970 [Sphingopyxis bauzanensis]
MARRRVADETKAGQRPPLVIGTVAEPFEVGGVVGEVGSRRKAAEDDRAALAPRGRRRGVGRADIGEPLRMRRAQGSASMQRGFSDHDRRFSL